MKSSAVTVEEYLSGLPKDRAEPLSKIRREILKVLPEGYEEAMNWGMICYQVPLSIYPDTYNKQPFMFVALASQKNHMAIYLMGVYMQSEKVELLEKQFARAGKKLDMGKACIRFKKIDDLVLEPILNDIKACKMDKFISYAKARTTNR